MTDLITQWGELEPERCRVYDSPEGVPHVDFIEIDWLAMELGAHEDLAMVTQYAVQRAIEAHSLWQLAQMVSTRYRATILGGFSATGDTPAHALLSAYLKVLEAKL